MTKSRRAWIELTKHQRSCGVCHLPQSQCPTRDLLDYTWGRTLIYCLVCAQIRGGEYQVTDSTWEEAGFLAKDGYCHLSCLQTALGRELQKSDFADAPINDVVMFNIS